MFYVHRDHRMEGLVRALAELVRDEPPPPFQPETLVVSSKGMERWLSLELARSLGVWSNASYPFPRAFVDKVLGAVLAEDVDAALSFSRESLRWAVLGLLPELLHRPELGVVRGYLEGDERGDKRLELAGRLAHAFDQYAVYRPELVAEWEAGEGQGFQPLLWRALVEKLGPNHLAARAQRFRERWAALDAPVAGVPARVSIFGVSALPPIFVEVLALLSSRVDVHLFLSCPSDLRWRALAAERPKLRSLRQRGGTAAALADGVVALEPPGLLGALGRVEGELQQVLETVVDYVDVAPGPRSEPDTRCALGALQADVIAARAPGSGPARRLAPEDSSLRVHSCHGPMREVEILRDQLLALFHDDPTLEPHDVIVMTPDVEAHAPFVNAVFGVDPDAPGYIPYRIADRSRRATNPVAKATLELFDVLFGRVSASSVLDLLQLAPIRTRFGFEVEDSARVERWVRETGVRWGIDAQHRGELGLPARPENTWRFGLERLLLGFALPGEERLLFEGALPFDAIEGRAASVAGRLAELVEAIAAWRERVKSPRPLAEWRGSVTALLAEFVAVADAEAWQLRVVQQSLDALSESAERVGFGSPLGPESFRRVLLEELEAERSSHDFSSGGVTFCELLPMRSVPFRVVCLMGMNDGDFPRNATSPAFDEIARAPRVGDRRVRDEDRHSFLEALMCARDHVVVTYVGRGIQDDGVRPPSVVLAELLDAVDATFQRERPRLSGQLELFAPQQPESKPERPASAAIVLAHPLQAFSERYFGMDPDPRLQSFARTELSAARALAAGARTRPPFLSSRLAPSVERVVTLDDLGRFFSNPAKFLLERRLGLTLGERVEVPSDREPMELDALERYGVGSFLSARFLEGSDDDEAFRVARAAGLLPHGTPGEVAFVRIAAEARSLTRATSAWRRGERLAPIPVELPVGDWTIRGTLRDVWPDAQVEQTYSRSKAKRELALWIRHLALQLAAPEGHPCQSVFVARSRDGRGIELRRFSSLDAATARERLEELCSLYHLGQSEPLCFFPDSALEYVETLIDEGNDEEAHDKALARAIKHFEPSTGHTFPEGADPFVRHVFGERVPLRPDFRAVPDALAPDFTALARSVFGPLLAKLVTELVT